MSQALYRKWRPARFDDVVGQEHVTRTLRNAIVAGRSGHAYLFCGPRGTGKTTTARLLAKAVNCLHDDLAERPCNECANCRAIADGRFLDLIEIDAASNTGVDDIRALRDRINFSPSEGRYKVYIVDEVHMLSTAAFNALLKTLEEPPPHAKFVLATTEEHKVPMTIKSRCQQFNFRLLTVQEIGSRLEWMAEREHLTVEPDALSLIARQGAGSIRDAESLLDQLVTGPEDTITLQRVQMVLGTASTEVVNRLTEALLDGAASRGLQVIHDALASGTDARQFARQMVDYLRQLLLLQAAGDTVVLDMPAEAQEEMRLQAQRASRSDLIEAIKRFNDAALAPSSSWQPQLPLELAFIELTPDEAEAVNARKRPSPEEAEMDPVPPRTPIKEGAEPPTKAEVQEPEREDDSRRTSPSAGQERAQPKQDPAAREAGAVASPRQKMGGGRASLEDVKAVWAEMVAQIRTVDKNLPALLAMCKPLAVEGRAIVLGFEFPLLKDKFEDKGNAPEEVAQVFSELLNQRYTVRCVVSDRYTPPKPTSEALEAEFYALADELGGEVNKI